MTQILSKIFIVILIMCGGMFLLNKAIRRHMWLKISRQVLKKYLGIETRAYLRWHEKNQIRLQKMLDREHKYLFAPISTL